jgi:hypothetical protein
MKLQKLGGYFCFAIIFALIFLYMIVPILGIKSINEIKDPVEAMHIFRSYPRYYRVLSQAAAIFVGVFYVVFAFSLQERMKSKAPNLMRFAVIAAVIAAVAPFIGSMINDSLMEVMVQNNDPSYLNVVKGIQAGFSSASMHGWGWVTLLTGIAAIKSQMLPKVLSYILFIGGIKGVLDFAIPPFGAFEMIISLILALLTYIWLGIHLIRIPDPTIE